MARDSEAIYIVNSANTQPAEFTGVFHSVTLPKAVRKGYRDSLREQLSPSIVVAEAALSASGEGHAQAANDLAGMLEGLARSRQIHDVIPHVFHDEDDSGISVICFMSSPHFETTLSDMNGAANSFLAIASQSFRIAGQAQF